jgi:hypothetical protein
MQLSTPSSKIDTTVCDLIAKLSNFSDEHFDAEWMHLSDDELETLTIHLIQYLTQNLDGRLLAGLLLIIREQEESPCHYNSTDPSNPLSRGESCNG